MQRVLSSQLEFPGGDGRYYFEDEPFSGVAYVLGRNGSLETESEYREGLSWGGGPSVSP
jgi:hypothetical protein